MLQHAAKSLSVLSDCMSFKEMNNKYFLLGRWVEEGKIYSVIQNTSIIDPCKKHLQELLIGTVIDVEWEDESAPFEVLDICTSFKFAFMYI